MFKIRKCFSILLCIAICGSLIVPVVATQNTQEQEIEQLFEQLTENIALSLLDENQAEIQSYNDETKQIEEQLSALGVTELNPEELDLFLSQTNDISLMVSKPTDTNTVKWYLYNYKNYSYGSEKYDVQKLIAVGYEPGGMLVTGEDNYRFFSNKEKVINFGTEIASIYVQKGISMIPVVRWTPYELLFSDSTNVVINSSYMTYRCVSSIAFTYVKKSTLSDDYYTLSLFSNKFSIASNAHGAGVDNGVPKTYSDQKTDTVYSDYYNSISAAIQSYNGAAGVYDYTSSITLYSYDKEYSKKVYVPTPLAGPGQIY